MNPNSKSQNIAAAINAFFKEINAEDKITNAKITGIWRKVMGNSVSDKTRKIFLKESKLVIITDSAALRHTLQHSKIDVVKRLNNELGYNMIQEIQVY